MNRHAGQARYELDGRLTSPEVASLERRPRETSRDALATLPLVAAGIRVFTTGTNMGYSRMAVLTSLSVLRRRASSH
jgi:hypothetical protein